MSSAEVPERDIYDDLPVRVQDHICEVCAEPSVVHREACGLAIDCDHYPPLCCNGCPCEQTPEMVHPHGVKTLMCGCKVENGTHVREADGVRLCNRCNRRAAL